jgi:6,7-dimethyl-8-ribityllumazine synthase
MSELRHPRAPGRQAAAPFCFALVVSRTNGDITAKLLEGARRTLASHGAAEEAVRVFEVPGAFELPMTAAELAATGAYDAVICLGALIKGETSHFEHLCAAVAAGIQDVGILSGIPAVFGVLTCEERAQAEARSGGAKGNKGAEAALAAIEMAALFAAIAAEHEE